MALASEFKGRLLEMEGLPTLPVYVQRLLRALEQEELRASELEQIIRQDPAISSRLLKVANSAFFGRSGQINTLERAIVLLGTRFIQALAVSVSLVDTLAHDQGPGRVRWEGFWIHSFACAWACQKLSRLEAFSPIREGAFFSGLLHDMGKPVLWLYQSEFYEEVAKRIGEQDLETHQAEKAILGVHHGEVGGMLAEWWKLPSEIQEAVRLHHEVHLDLPTVRLVRLADHAARLAGFDDGLRSNGATAPVFPGTLAEVELEAVQEVTEELSLQPEEIQQVVKLLHGGAP